MSSPGFRFKQFYVAHDKCAMKVGTDGVLLGAMAPVRQGPLTIDYLPLTIDQLPMRVLDIGTGTGLVALMLAQRLAEASKTSKSSEASEASETSKTSETSWSVDAIDIDPDAVAQAQENFAASPWSEHLHAYQCRLQEWNSPYSDDSGRYDMIVSNPPYFRESLKNPDAQRQAARHTDTLSYEELVTHSLRLLKPGGTLTLILPAEAEEDILAIAAQAGLRLIAHTRIYSKEGKPQLRSLMTWGSPFPAGKPAPFPPQGQGEATTDDKVAVRTFYIQSAHSPRSEEYAELCKDFYL